jgi:hypothetical protein
VHCCGGWQPRDRAAEQLLWRGREQDRREIKELDGEAMSGGVTPPRRCRTQRLPFVPQPPGEDRKGLRDQFEEGGSKASGVGRMRGFAVIDDFIEFKHIRLHQGASPIRLP